MKKTYLILGAVIIFMASFSKANLSKEKPVLPYVEKSHAVQTSVGEKLINKSDCMGCHTKLTKLIGPAFIDIAKKYKPTTKNIDLLAGKVIKGGTGVWGTLPMTAHDNIKKEDAKAMVKYILSVKK